LTGTNRDEHKNNLVNHLLFIKKVLFTLMLYAILFSCKKEVVEQIVIPQFDSVADIEKHYYKTIKIGDQWWMAENLQVKLYNDGSPIRNAESELMWKEQAGAYCIYKNDITAPGLLYNWFAVNDARKLAPIGWHIATEDDWQKMESYLGMNNEELRKTGWRGTNQGIKLKAYGRSAWLTEVENWPTNESGFSALAGSCRRQNGIWGAPGLFQTGFWWTATDHKEGKAFYRYLDSKSNQVFRDYDYKNSGFSVRCVKD
jgi:uncharacterized protein (TIGR02145 family)